VSDEQPQFSGGSVAPTGAWSSASHLRFVAHGSVPYDIQEIPPVIWGRRNVPDYRDEGFNVRSEANYAGLQVQAASRHVCRREPQVIELPSLGGVLTDRRRSVLDGLLHLFKREAFRHCIPLTKIEISGYSDPEADFEEVVITHWVRMSAALALDYWDKLGNAIVSWKCQLPDELAIVLADHFAVEVRWETNG
jgi:hypothetical protein